MGNAMIIFYSIIKWCQTCNENVGQVDGFTTRKQRCECSLGTGPVAVAE